jgi:hypothetical protein
VKKPLWVEGMVVTLVREGLMKQRAREIAFGYWDIFCKDGNEELTRLRAELAETTRRFEELKRHGVPHEEHESLRAKVEALRLALNVASGALLQCEPCMATECAQVQREWLDDARKLIDAALKEQT